MTLRSTLKTYFQTGDTPTQSQFEALIDSLALTVTSTSDLTEAAPNGTSALVDGLWEFGLFRFSTANLSAMVSSDPDKALFVAPNSDATGASGAWVRQVMNREYDLDWWLRGATTLVQAAINRASKLAPTFCDLLVPVRDMTITRAATGTVNAGSSSFFGGIVGGIYIDKMGQRLIGKGRGAHFNCEARAMNAIMVRASHCRVEKLMAGNCAGQLETSESASVCFQPSNFVHSNTGGGNGFDITNLVVSDCDFYNCDTGVTGSPEREFKASEPPRYLYRASKLRVENCRITGCTRQGVELFQCDDSIVDGCSFAGADKGVYTYSRFVRVIGSKNTQVTNTVRAVGFSDADTGYIGVEVSTSGWYGQPEHYDIAKNVIIDSNQFHGFGRHVQIEDSQGVVAIEGNIFTNDHGTNGIQAINVNTQNIRNPAGNTTSETNKIACENLSIVNNRGTGQAVFVNIPGTIYQGEIVGNRFTANNATSQNLVNIDLPGTHPLERVHVLTILDNTAFLKPSVTTAPIAITGLKANDQIFIDSNKLTPTGGGIIVHSGLGTVLAQNRYSNVAIAGTLWTDKFNPPRGPVFGEPNV